MTTDRFFSDVYSVRIDAAWPAEFFRGLIFDGEADNRAGSALPSIAEKGMCLVTNDPETLTDASGAYLLLIKLKGRVDLPRRFASESLTKGYYAYAGSAYGPGGIRARCRRHLQRPATQRWHIDWLTRSADDVQAVAFPGGSECRLMETLIECAKTRVPIPGFGSTDCRQCRAHLVAFNGRDCWDDVIRAQLANIVGIEG